MTGVLVGLAAAVTFDLADGGGARHTQAEWRDARAVVLAFVSPACPLSKRFETKLHEIRDDYTSRGVRVVAVSAEIGGAAATLIDPGLTLARQLGATATPEAVIVSRDGHVLYRGIALRQALDDVLAGRVVSAVSERAVGCALPYPVVKRKTWVDWRRDVAPLIGAKCAVCHRGGEAAPFALLTHADAARRARTIAAVTAAGLMPPWLPSRMSPPMAGERRLTAREIAVLREWAEAGAPGSGDSPAPSAAESRIEGETFRMRTSFSVAAAGRDQYRCFAIPNGQSADRWVDAMAFTPGNRRVVHHALVFADTSGEARKRDRGDGYECFGVPGFLPSASFGGWTPGMTPIPYPEGVAMRLRRGADIVLQVHYQASGAAETDQSAVTLRFTDRPPTRRLMDVALGSRDIDIPAGARGYRVRDYFTLPVNVEAIGIIPHAHLVCRSMKGVAVLPSGRRVTLIDIPRWDFHWQQNYRYRTPITLPAGTRVEMDFRYDNALGRRVQWGPDSSDEMAGLHVQVIPRNDEDARELGQSLWGKIMRSVGGRFYELPPR